MATDFLGMIAAGIGVGAFMFALNHLLRRRLAKWALPAAIGAAMIAFTIYREYTWYPTVRAALPAETVVALAPTDTFAYRPWTYLFPLTLRFIVVDKTVLKRALANPDLIVVDAVVIQRWTPSQRIPMAVDCANGRRADLLDGASLGEDGITGATWVDVGAEDVLVKAACAGA